MSKKAANTAAHVRVLKNGTCSNLSGKSTLSYRIGVNEAGEIMLHEADGQHVSLAAAGYDHFACKPAPS